MLLDLTDSTTESGPPRATWDVFEPRACPVAMQVTSVDSAKKWEKIGRGDAERMGRT